MPDEDKEFVAFTVPGSTIVNAGVSSVFKSKDDPEDTMQIALTHRDLALIVFYMTFTARLFPELSIETASLMSKLIELAAFQEFLPWGDDEIKRFTRGDT